MKTIKAFSDGGRVCELDGVRVVCTRSGSLVSMSDWSRADELVRAGLLDRDEWRGNGLYGHDTYSVRS